MQPRRGFGVINETFSFLKHFFFPTIFFSNPLPPPPRPLRVDLTGLTTNELKQQELQNNKKRFWKLGVNILYIVETYLSCVCVCMCVCLHLYLCV